MFDLAYSAKDRVLLSRFRGTYSLEDITLRDSAVRRFAAKNGLVRGVMDFTAVESISIPLDVLIRRAHQPGILTGQQRVIIAASEPAYSFNRLVAAHQLYARKVEPLLVRSSREAHEVLGIVEPTFLPLDHDKAARLDRILHDVLRELDEIVAARALDEETVQRTLLRVTGRVPPSPKVAGHITLSEVINASLRSNVLRDSRFRSVCFDCGSSLPLSWMAISAGRVTTYSCPACHSWLVRLSHLRDTDAMDPSGYALAGFEVVSRVALDILGVRLPKTEGE